MSATKTDGAIRGLERIKADFEMRGANATTIERAIDCIRALASKDIALAEIRAELAEFDEANRMLVKSADGWRDKFWVAESELDALKKHNDGLVVLFEKFHAQKEAAEAELKRLKEPTPEQLAAAWPHGFVECYELRKFLGNLASLAISQDGEERS